MLRFEDAETTRPMFVNPTAIQGIEPIRNPMDGAPWARILLNGAVLMVKGKAPEIAVMVTRAILCLADRSDAWPQTLDELASEDGLDTSRKVRI